MDRRRKHKPTAKDDRQAEFNFPRAEQLAMLRDARLPAMRSSDGSLVAEAVLKSVLRVIDDHGRGRECFLKSETIAAESGWSIRHVKRSIEVLRSLSLLCIERRRTSLGPVCNHYRIVWSELALLAEPKCRGGTLVPPDQSAVVTDQSAVVTKQSAATALAIGSAQETYKEPPPPTPRFLRDASPHDAWSAAAAEMVSTWGFDAGVAAERTAAAREAGQTPAGFLDQVGELLAIATAPENARRLERPAAAVIYRLRSGNWPADGIVEADTLTLVRARRTSAADRQAHDSRLYAIVREGRKQGLAEEAIRAQLRAELPEDFCAERGW